MSVLKKPQLYTCQYTDELGAVLFRMHSKLGCDKQQLLNLSLVSVATTKAALKSLCSCSGTAVYIQPS